MIKTITSYCYVEVALQFIKLLEPLRCALRLLVWKVYLGQSVQEWIK